MRRRNRGIIIGAGGGEPTPPSGYPDETNTGVPAGWTPTTTFNGTLVLDQPFTVYDGYLVNGKVQITAEGVTFQNSKVIVQNLGDMGIDIYELGTTVQDVEVDGNSLAKNCIQGLGNMFRCNIHSGENGINLASNLAARVENNYIHDLSISGEPHYDGITNHGDPRPYSGSQNIEHNTIVSRDTSCIFIKNDFGPIRGMFIYDNLLLGNPPPSYAVYVDNSGASGGLISEITLVNNKVQSGANGYFSISPGQTVSIAGNTDAFTGDPIS